MDHGRLDVTDEMAVHEAVTCEKPEWVIHTAAMTAVDACEDSPVAAYEVNAFGCQWVARACAKTGTHLIIVSTDYVFPGTEARAMEVWDPPRPLSVYGKSKWAGEVLAFAEWTLVWVVRTSYLYYGKGPSLMSRLLERALAGQPLRLVTDQTVVPTYAPDLAISLRDLIRKDPEPGVYHVTGSEAGSPMEIGTALLRVAGVSVPVQDILLEQIPQKAPRPKYSVLSGARAVAAGLQMPRSWKDALEDFLAQFHAMGRGDQSRKTGKS